MRIFYDTEFWEQGYGIGIIFISIGMVREDGAQYYAVNGDMSFGLEVAISADSWLGDNVWKYLPLTPQGVLDHSHEDVKSKEQIAADIIEFCGGEKAELWAYYADYDHVVLCSLFGRMIDLPSCIPMYTHDLKQEIDRVGWQGKVGSVGAEHHALSDALGVKAAWDDLEDRKWSQGILDRALVWE